MATKGVLLVDDEALALKYFSKAFANRFTVFAAHSAAEALGVLERHHQEIGVLVTDQRMPESNGIELLRVVRQRYPRVVRILTTAYSELELLIEAINTGAVYSFVTKPWQLNDLERTLEEALAHSDRESEAQRMLAQKLEDFRATVLEGRTYDVALIAARIGHYVHNALCPVALLVDQLAERNDSRESLSPDFLRSVGSHVHEVSRTLKDLAHISMVPAAREFRPVDMDRMLERALAGTEILRAEKGLRVEADVTADLPPVFGVPSQMETLFRFMLAEEIVSLPAGSRLRLRLRPQEADGEVTGVRVEFEDDEPLGDIDTPASLLEPFNVRGSNPREFGIFLASSYLIVQHHGGSFDARLKAEGGVIFTFFLPVVESKVMDKTAKERLREA